MTDDLPVVSLSGRAMVPLVRAAAALESDDLPRSAVIGGVAVAVRLGRVLRATADLDAVTDYGNPPTTLDVLRSRHDVISDAADSRILWIDGVEIQFQEVTDVDDHEIEGLDPKNLLYVTSHSYALSAASRVRVRATDGETRVEAAVRVAPSGALLAMKLHAYLDRSDTAEWDKRPGDLWDIYNLLLFSSEGIAKDLWSARWQLRTVVAELLERELVGHGAQARSVLRRSRDERYQAITAADLAFSAEGLIDRISR